MFVASCNLSRNHARLSFAAYPYRIGDRRGASPAPLSITHKSVCQVAGLLPHVARPNALYGASFPTSEAKNRSFTDAFAKPSTEMWVMDSWPGVQGWRPTLAAARVGRCAYTFEAHVVFRPSTRKTAHRQNQVARFLARDSSGAAASRTCPEAPLSVPVLSLSKG